MAAGRDHRMIAVTRNDRVATIELHRPQALNALNTALMDELVDAASAFDDDRSIGAIVVRGSETAFAAGADIREMASQTYGDVFLRDWFAPWDRFAAVRTPTVAAVAGHALGGGCELALMCDVVIAADTARFGQPEIKLGTIPGIGGSQRLTRSVGKAKAMDMILTGRTIDAREAERIGIVSRVVASADLASTAEAVAAEIAAYSLPALYAAKEAVNRAFETPLAEGLRFERRTFHATFALADRTEGMTAFLEKRDPGFGHR
jgi:enoyl-CoA hydratase